MCKLFFINKREREKNYVTMTNLKKMLRILLIYMLSFDTKERKIMYSRRISSFVVSYR